VLDNWTTDCYNLVTIAKVAGKAEPFEKGNLEHLKKLNKLKRILGKPQIKAEEIQRRKLW
jgi:hypothetical protein